MGVFPVKELWYDAVIVMFPLLQPRAQPCLSDAVTRTWRAWIEFPTSRPSTCTLSPGMAGCKAPFSWAARHRVSWESYGWRALSAFWGRENPCKGNGTGKEHYLSAGLNIMIDLSRHLMLQESWTWEKGRIAVSPATWFQRLVNPYISFHPGLNPASSQTCLTLPTGHFPAWSAA